MGPSGGLVGPSGVFGASICRASFKGWGRYKASLEWKLIRTIWLFLEIGGPFCGCPDIKKNLLFGVNSRPLNFRNSHIRSSSAFKQRAQAQNTLLEPGALKHIGRPKAQHKLLILSPIRAFARQNLACPQPQVL